MFLILQKDEIVAQIKNLELSGCFLQLNIMQICNDKQRFESSVLEYYDYGESW